MRWCNLFATVFVILSAGCSSHNGQDYEAVTVYIDANLDKTSLEQIRLSKYVNNVQFIPISCEGPFRPVGPIARYCRGYYYVVDSESQRIFKINEEGNVVSHIGSQGRASYEYLSITSFDVNPSTSEVYVYDIERNMMVVYSGDGQYVRSFTIDDSNCLFRDFVVFPNGNIIGCDFIYVDPSVRRGVWMVDGNGHFLKQIVSIEKGNRYHIEHAIPLFSKIGEEYVCIMGDIGDDSVYKIDSTGNVVSRYVFDFGSQISSRDIRKKAEISIPDYFFIKHTFSATAQDIYILGSKGKDFYSISYDILDNKCLVTPQGKGLTIQDVPNYSGGAVTDGSRYLNFCDTNSLPPDVPVTDSTALWMVVTHLKNN